jgi:signal transduction histidine kinase/ligand-binding sensor domain-containing protein
MLVALFAVPLVWTGLVEAAEGGRSSWYSRAWQSEDGLPNNTVSGLAQTPDGYLWLGTPSGIARFDGIRFEDFSPTNFIAPPNRGTVTMLWGRSGVLWLAMDRGAVVRLQGESSRAFTAGLPEAIPNGLAEDAQGTLWVAYRSGEVYRIQDTKVTRVGESEGLPPGGDICALASDAQGRVWFAKNGQLGIVADGVLKTLRRVDDSPARLATSRASGVWLLCGFHLYKAQPTGALDDWGEFRPARGGTIGTVMLEDREGALWIGTTFSGLFRRDETRFETVETTHEEILSLAQDHEGNMWVGTAGGGLNRLRQRTVSLEGTEAGLPFAAVQSICQDSAGTIWAATQNGVLARRVAGRWTALPAAENWPTDATSVTADTNGTVWIGTRLHGLYCWREGRFVTWGNPADLRGQTLHTLLVSRTGDLWIGEETPPAIQRLRGGRLSTFEVPQDSRVIRAMAEDAAGNIWAGTSKGVMFRIQGDKLAVVNPRADNELASIRCLTATPNGALWIGYAGWGVGCITGGRFFEVRAEQGLYDDYISHVVSDGRGWLWFGANRGIFKVREQDLLAVGTGNASRVRSIHYGRSEGLPSLQGTFGDSPDALRSRDGRLWLPMRTALAVVEPSGVEESPEPPSTMLNRVSVDDRTVARYRGVLPGRPHHAEGVQELNFPTTKLQLPPEHRRLELQFTALSFSAPENLQFRYRLEGFDEEWREAGTRRVASYSRLAAGDYRFQVVASDANGEWGKRAAELKLVVVPFFYQTWWFRLCGLAVFTLCVAAVVRYVSFRRLHRKLRLLEAQEALHKERARIAKDIHDDVGANLTQIALLGDLAQQDREQPQLAGERIGRISVTARQAIKSLDEIVWAVNPRNDTLGHLIDYAGQYALDYLRVAGVRCRLDLPEQPPAREVSTDVRHNLFLIVKEALNNVVKHARASTVWLRVNADGERLRMEIEDDGRGFDRPPADAEANGLRNLRQRAAEIGGRCEIESRSGAGTRVSVELPWARQS